MWLLKMLTYPMPDKLSFGGKMLKLQQNPSSVETSEKI